jgi:hypothetical protein
MEANQYLVQANHKYLKKNTESNISNQVFSFLASQNKSGPYLQRLIERLGLKQPEEVTIAYYHYMRVIKWQKRKYLNKKFLEDLIRGNAYREALEEALSPALSL